MRLCHLIPLLLCTSSLLAQVPPEFRRDSASFGLGFHTQGPMLTFMHAGTRLGFFSGLALKPTSSPALQGAPENTSNGRYERVPTSTSEAHLGLAYRMDSRWVFGLGLGLKTDNYAMVYHPPTIPWIFGMPTQPEGGLFDQTVGPVFMADLRLGSGWGIHAVGGSTGLGAAVSRRF